MCFFVNANGNWDCERISTEIPDEIVQCINQMKPPCSSSRPDYMEWIHSDDGQFTTHDAYSKLSCMLNLEDYQLCKSIWRWHEPKHIKYLL